MATDEGAGAEIVRGKEACELFSMELLKELGFPSGALPMGELEECGRVRSSCFVWWKRRASFEHFSAGTNSKNNYATETTAYVEKGRMKKMTGCKAKPMMVWIGLAEMHVEGSKLTFKSSLGVSKSFPLISFMNEEEKKVYAAN